MPPSIKILVLFISFVTFILGSPTIQKRGVYKIERVPNPNFIGHNGPKQLLRALRKYQMPTPEGLVEAAKRGEQVLIERRAFLEKRQNMGTGSANTTNAATGAAAAANNGTKAAGTATGKVAAMPAAQDVEYVSPVTVGGQNVTLDFDSGSSDLWLFGAQLGAASTKGHQTFDNTKSTTFKPMTGATFRISYGDGSGATGTVGTDTVDIGGATVTNQAVEVASAVSQSFVSDTASNGLVGLAFSKLNTVKPTQQKTFFDNLMPSLKMPVFTADLNKNAAGSYEFGNIDSTKFTGAMAWVPVNTTQGFWQFASTKFQVGTSPAQTGTAGFQAIADTGTTLMLVDSKVATTYYSQVQGAANNAQVGGFTFPCSATLPDLAIDIGGNLMTVKGNVINYTPVDNANTTCFGGVQATTQPGLGIYGDIFFKGNFVAFNGGNNSLGVAPKSTAA